MTGPCVPVCCDDVTDVCAAAMREYQPNNQMEDEMVTVGGLGVVDTSDGPWDRMVRSKQAGNRPRDALESTRARAQAVRVSGDRPAGRAAGPNFHIKLDSSIMQSVSDQVSSARSHRSARVVEESSVGDEWSCSMTLPRTVAGPSQPHSVFSTNRLDLAAAATAFNGTPSEAEGYIFAVQEKLDSDTLASELFQRSMAGIR
mmetsp:Transcript_17073/g.37598  ORF Transcript_17073/g.37598 Transcript_17073/m.37598 type:complete len:201 (+) Transcript_17073:66-668(+)